MERMEQTILATLAKHNMLQDTNNVIVALSGGADSVALFHVLLRHGGALGITVQAAHFEHGMRGETSLRDADFVAALCRRKGVKLHVGHGNMQKEKRPAAMSAEEWARRLRYAFLEGLAGEDGSTKVATAHNLNDNAETVLFHAIRGAGPKGLAGIPPVRGPFIRPLLGVARREIEAYCETGGLAYMTDETNADTKYARNRLRQEVLPLLEEIHPGATKVLARQAGDMRALDDWLEAEAIEALRAAKVAETELPYPQAPRVQTPPVVGAKHGLLGRYRLERLQQAPPPLRLKVFALLAGPSASRDCLARMQAVVDGESKAAGLPGGRRCLVRKGQLVIEPEAGAEMDKNAEPVEIPLEPGRFDMPGGYRFSVEICGIDDFTAQFTVGSKKSHRKVLNFAADYDKIARNSVFRARLPGDCFHFAARGVTKPLKKWMNEQGLSAAQRRQLPLLAHGGNVLWLYGEGFDGRLAVSDGTKRVLVIREEMRS